MKMNEKKRFFYSSFHKQEFVTLDLLGTILVDKYHFDHHFYFEMFSKLPIQREYLPQKSLVECCKTRPRITSKQTLTKKYHKLRNFVHPRQKNSRNFKINRFLSVPTMVISLGIIHI